MLLVRKNQNTLSAAERQALVNAILLLKKAPSRFQPPTSSRYDDYVYIHFQAMNELTITDPTKPVANGNWTSAAMAMQMYAHRCPAFPAWHCELLHQFEMDLQQVSGNTNLALAYWDWSVDQSPTGPPWTDDFMGGDG